MLVYLNSLPVSIPQEYAGWEKTDDHSLPQEALGHWPGSNLPWFLYIYTVAQDLQDHAFQIRKHCQQCGQPPLFDSTVYYAAAFM